MGQNLARTEVRLYAIQHEFEPMLTDLTVGGSAVDG